MSNEPPPEKKLPLHRRFLPTTTAGKAAAATALTLLVILVIVWILRFFGADSVRLIHAVPLSHMIIECALVVLIPFVLYWGIRRWNQVIEGEYPEIDRAWEAGVEALRAKGVSPSDYPIFLVLGSSSEEVEHGLMEALDTKMIIHGIPDASGVSHALQWYMSSDAIYLFCPGASSLSALMSRWTAPTMTTSVSRKSFSASSPTNDLAGGAARSGKVAPQVSQDSPAGLPKIERAATSNAAGSTGSTPSSPPVLKKESQLRPSSPPGNAPKSDPEPYLGTIQHHSLDNSPKGSSGREAAPVASAGTSPFDRPASAPFSQTDSPARDDAMRPAPRYQGTISFTQDSADSRSTPQSTASSPARSSGSPVPSPASTSPPNPAANSAANSPTQRKPLQASPATSAAASRLAVNKQIALPASLDTSDQLPRLRYVCKLLKRARRPMCGINGAITLLPFELSRVGPLQLSAIAQSARGDVKVIQETLGVRSPVTAVLIGLEQDKGFTELTRRLQAGLLSRRLGGRFDLRSRPTPEELNTHSDRLCDAFEDWVYRLFSRDDGLEQQRGNRKLYALTCKIRHELKPRLRIVLGQAFGCQSSQTDTVATTDDSFFFSGCYFAASGAITGQAAFVKGVLQDKLVDEQSKVQWTEETLRTHQIFRIFAVLGWIVVSILALIAIVQLV